MNKSVIEFLVLVLLSNLGLGCTRELGSETKSEDIGVHNDFVHQTSSIGLICPSYALVFLIGSSEAASSVDEWNIAIPSRADVEKNGAAAALKFKAAIEKAKKDLVTAFARDPKCKSPFELIFATIIDGPGSLDSSIETMHYGMTTKSVTATTAWKRTGTKSWSLDDGNLVPRNAAFELNMAKDVSVITQILAKNSARTIATNRNLAPGNTVEPGQILYILKTHGARVATDSKYQPTLANLKEHPRLDLAKNEWQSAILMDTNGTTSRLSSPVYSAHWNPADLNAVRTTNTAGETDSDTAGETDSDTAGETDSDTAGETDSDTAGDGSFDTAGEVGATSGSKALSFQKSLSDQVTPDYLGKRILGSFATYAGSASIGEETQIRFPVGNDIGVKNLIILDSCYASSQILEALEYESGRRGKTVVLASVNELYFEFFDYSSLDLAGFLKMPLLLERLKTSNDLTVAEKELLVNMSKGTLDWQNKSANSAYKELAIWHD